jgi:hypothetical protein
MQRELPSLSQNESRLSRCSILWEENARLREEVALLRDEVAVLKGHKPRPKFKGSNLAKKYGKGNDPPGPVPGRAPRATRVPASAQFKDYRNFVVRGLVIRAHNIRVRREFWLLADGTYLLGGRPPSRVRGPALRPYAARVPA